MSWLRNEYHFVTHWRVEGTCSQAFAILSDAAGYMRWWPEVYLTITITEPGDERGVGKKGNLYTRGWLPYHLRWTFTVTEVNPPHGFAIAAVGDFAGTGVWLIQQDGAYVNITYDWNIVANKPLLKFCSLFLKPLFCANHRWAMRKGGQALEREMARVRRYIA